MKEYYTQRAGAGLIISEATAISTQGYGWYGAPGCYTEEQSAAWKVIVDSVHEKGGKIFLQLWHMGRQSGKDFHEKPEDFVSASAIGITGKHRDAKYNEIDYEVPRALETYEIPGVVAMYKNCAALAKKAGFDGVEVHAANGYLIDQFLQSCSNKRTDKYGGVFENRARLLLEVIEAVKEVYPSNRIGVRISPNGVFGGMGSEDNYRLFTYVCSQLKPLNLSYLHIMDGLGWGFHGKCEVFTTFDAKKNFEGTVISNLGHTPESADGIIRSGAAQLVAFGRQYMSNPDLAERIANGWPLVDAPAWDYGSYYGYSDPALNPKGYTDYPAYSPAK